MAGRQAQVIVTGLKQLDDKLAALGPKLQNKLGRKALRNCAKKVVKSTQAIVQSEAYHTGTIYRNFKIKALKRSRVRVGIAMFIDRNNLFQEYEEAYGHPPNPADGEADPYYYLAAIEFGYRRPDGSEVRAIRPMRRALYDNANSLQAFFVQDIKEMLDEVDSKR